MDLDEAYRVLCVRKEDATPESARASYRKLALRHHPDKNPGREEEAKAAFRRLSCAYGLVSEHLEGRTRGDDGRRSSTGESDGEGASPSPSWEEARDLFRRTFGEDFEDIVRAGLRAAAVGVGVGIVGAVAVGVGAVAVGVEAGAAAASALGTSVNRASRRLSVHDERLTFLRLRIVDLERALKRDRDGRNEAARELRDFVAHPRNVPSVAAHLDLEAAKRRADVAENVRKATLRDYHAFVENPDIRPEDVPPVDAAFVRTVTGVVFMVLRSYYGVSLLLMIIGFKPVFAIFHYLGESISYFQAYYDRHMQLSKRASVSAEKAASCMAEMVETRNQIEQILKRRVVDAESEIDDREAELRQARADLADSDSALGVVGAVLGIQRRPRLPRPEETSASWDQSYHTVRTSGLSHSLAWGGIAKALM